MSIFIDNGTTLIVQGITGRDGGFHTKQMIEYGTRVVGGVTPGKGGQTFDNTVPVFNTVHEAVKATGANTTVIYVPPMFAADAMMEAADAGVKFIVCFVWKPPSRPVMPCTMSVVALSMKMLTRPFLPLPARRPSALPRPCRTMR